MVYKIVDETRLKLKKRKESITELGETYYNLFYREPVTFSYAFYFSYPDGTKSKIVVEKEGDYDIDIIGGNKNNKYYMESLIELKELFALNIFESKRDVKRELKNYDNNILQYKNFENK